MIADLRGLGIDVTPFTAPRPSNAEFAHLQDQRAAELMRDLYHVIEDDARRLEAELGRMEQTRGLGQHFMVRELARHHRYLKHAGRVLAVMESAEARRGRAS